MCDPVNKIDPFGLIWVTIGHDNHGTKNTFITIVRHFAFAEEGKFIGDPSNSIGSTRDVIQEWQHDEDNPCKDKKYDIGDKRKIRTNS